MKRRHLVGLGILLACLVYAGVGLAAPWSHLEDGEYAGTVAGMWDDITVVATLVDGEITGIEITEGRDDLYLYDDQLEEFVKRILEKQSLDVDVVTGASVDCEAILAGLYEALETHEDTEESQK